MLGLKLQVTPFLLESLDGCFFHGHRGCGHVPKTNTAYWRAKILRNRRRDARVSRDLRSFGFSVIRIWECQLRSQSRWCLNRILQRLTAEGKLGEAGQKLEQLKLKIDELNARRK